MLMRNSEHRKELVSEIRSLAQSQGLNTVFTTFLEIAANSLAAQTDPKMPKSENSDIRRWRRPCRRNFYRHMLGCWHCCS